MRILSALFPAKIDPAAESAPALQPFRRRRGGGKENEFTSYYGRPILKKAHWTWQIWFYFWIGGIAAGASLITALTELFGNSKRDGSIIRAGRYISLAGLLISPVLLILDLGRPERFHHMLRVLKLRSPLSVGTYILSATGALGGLNAARQVVEDGLISKKSLPGQLVLTASGKATTSLQGLTGIGLGSYTGVLLSSTATPLWAEGDDILGPLFLASAVTTGAAAINLFLALTGEDVEMLHRLQTIERAATLAEMSLVSYGGAKLKPEVKKHISEGLYGAIFAGAVVEGQALPFLLSFVSPKRGPAARFFSIIQSLLALIGGFQLRLSIIEAGKNSTQNPDAYHAITRGRGRPTPQEQAQAAKG